MIGGTIHVNDIDVLTWEAENVNNTTTPGEVIYYEVKVTGRDRKGYPVDMDFALYLDGPAYLDLPIKILQEVQDRTAAR